MNRRNLTPSQRAIVMARAPKLGWGGDRGKSFLKDLPSRASRASRAAVGYDLQDKADAIEDWGDQDLLGLVFSGALAVTDVFKGIKAAKKASREAAKTARAAREAEARAEEGRAGVGGATPDSAERRVAPLRAIIPRQGPSGFLTREGRKRRPGGVSAALAGEARMASRPRTRDRWGWGPAQGPAGRRQGRAGRPGPQCRCGRRPLLTSPRSRDPAGRPAPAHVGCQVA